MPIWFLSGAFFPATGAPLWLRWIMRVNPLTYGMAALRRALYLDQSHVLDALPGAAPSLAISVVFAAVAMWLAARVAQHSRVIST